VPCNEQHKVGTLALDEWVAAFGTARSLFNVYQTLQHYPSFGTARSLLTLPNGTTLPLSWYSMISLRGTKRYNTTLHLVQKGPFSLYQTVQQYVSFGTVRSLLTLPNFTTLLLIWYRKVPLHMHHRHTEKHRHEGKPKKTRHYQRLCSAHPALCATVCSEKRSQVGQAVHPKCRVRRCKCYYMLGAQLCSLHTGHSTTDSSCCCCRVHLRPLSSAIP